MSGAWRPSSSSHAEAARACTPSKVSPGAISIARLRLACSTLMSEFLVVTSTFARAPWLALVLVAGILTGVAALFLRLNSIAFGEPRGAVAKAKASYVPMFTHLGLVLMAGVYIPPFVVTWFQNVAKLLG